MTQTTGLFMISAVAFIVIGGCIGCAVMLLVDQRQARRQRQIDDAVNAALAQNEQRDDWSAGVGLLPPSTPNTNPNPLNPVRKNPWRDHFAVRDARNKLVDGELGGAVALWRAEFENDGCVCGKPSCPHKRKDGGS